MNKKSIDASNQLDLLSQDTRDPGQVMSDLEKQRDLINRCLNLGEEIITLVNLDADRLLNDVRFSKIVVFKELGIEEVKKAMGKRNGHLSQQFHHDFSKLFGKAMRDMNETNLVCMRDVLIAMEEVTSGVVDIGGVRYPVNKDTVPLLLDMTSKIN